MTRKELIRKIDARLGNRKLVWFGTRGEDVQPLLDLPQFSEVYSLIAPFGGVSLAVDECLEVLTGRRVDLDTYSLDHDHSDEARELRRRLFRSLSEPAVLVPYRPLAFLSSVQYPRSDYVEYLGLFHERQAPFEHKPWVESELRRIGIPVIPWRYYTDDDRLRVEEQLCLSGPVVLRSNRSDGGVGLTLVRTPADLNAAWRLQPDGFLAVAPLLEPHIPLNISACVFEDGWTSLHPPSVQLLGVEGLTTRPFGYCGNDFAALRYLDHEVLVQFLQMVRLVGSWLHSKGYTGAFGVDAIVHLGELYLAEINPRFQGSSALSAHIDAKLDRPDVYSCHIAAFLRISPGQSRSLSTVEIADGEMAQILCHHCGQNPVRLHSDPSRVAFGSAVSLLPGADVFVEPNAILMRQWTPGPITKTGHSIDASLSGEIKSDLELLFGPDYLEVEFACSRTARN